MFYTKTAEVLSYLFSAEKQPGGGYHDTRAPLLALYHAMEHTEELQAGMQQFINCIREKSENKATTTYEQQFLIQPFKDSHIISTSAKQDSTPPGPPH